MVARLEVAVAVTKTYISSILATAILVMICVPGIVSAQVDTTQVYKKRVLENIEIDFLSSYYTQDGQNAAVTGGIGTEELTDATATLIISVPLNDDDVLSIDAGISAYTSASSSNINPFDGDSDPYVASSGASSGDTWTNLTVGYSHSSDDRNTIWGAHGSISSEYDYLSIGFGGNVSRLFNQQNTEVSLSASVYLDTWTTIYPIELRSVSNFRQSNITGNTDYNPLFVPLTEKNRNSYALGLTVSQILSKNLQGSLTLDVTQQQGLLSTPFQRVYFQDMEDSFFDGFHLAEDIERLPDTRVKVALGGRLHYYISQSVALRTFARYYQDDWGIGSVTASIEMPIKLGMKWTIYPSYRFYNQSNADYFKPYNQHLTTDTYYTSDYDLSEYNANQYGFGVRYTDIFTTFHIGKLRLKSVDVKYYYYDRNTPFSSSIITGGLNFVVN